ncbi:MAG TPA: hypothetical protein PLX23_10195, partial [Candidatus Hydrogenedens sp.]|nr:hypothetical protein [Candidatus Hydrogenedens sp.]
MRIFNNKNYQFLILASFSLFIGITMSIQAQEKKPFFTEDFEQGKDRWEMTDPNVWTVSADDKGNHLLCLTGSSQYEPAVRSP